MAPTPLDVRPAQILSATNGPGGTTSGVPFLLAGLDEDGADGTAEKKEEGGSDSSVDHSFPGSGRFLNCQASVREPGGRG